MNTNNGNLSDKSDANSKTLRKQNQRTVDDLKNDTDKNTHFSSENPIIPLITSNSQDESFIGNNLGILYKDNILSETGSNISSFSPRRENLALSDSESNRSSTSTFLISSNVRRRALSTTSRPKDRFSMHEFGSPKVDDNDLANSKRSLSPARHSLAFDNGFSINNRMVIMNSLEDRERIGNAGKGFGNLINDEGGKGK